MVRKFWLKIKALKMSSYERNYRIRDALGNLYDFCIRNIPDCEKSEIIKDVKEILDITE